MRPTQRSLSDAGRDLVLGGTCAGCGVPGRVLCPACDAALPRCGRPAWPTPAPPGLVTPFAAGAYDGLLKAMVNQHKEQGAFALAAPLGRVLSCVVHDLVTAPGLPAGRATGATPVQLVPVPSRRSVVRRRGHDPLLRVAREAARGLRRRGVDAAVQQLLVASLRVQDQSTLGALDRASNLAGAMRCRRGAGTRRPGLVVIVDDVLTTGATAREAQRALEQVGVRVAGIATVAATRRRAAAQPHVA